MATARRPPTLDSFTRLTIGTPYSMPRVRRAHPIDTPHRHNTTNVSTTIVGRTCTASAAWTSASASVTPGHRYTLNLTNHDDNYGADPTYTLFDDVSLS